MKLELHIHSFEKVRGSGAEEQVKHLVDAYGDDFIPPLSRRSATDQTTFETSRDTESVYFHKMLEQGLVSVIDGRGGAMAGFLSYISNYRNEDLLNYNPSTYVSTIIVSAPYRGQGVARLLYKALIAEVDGKPVTTRTWSTNYAHIKLLEEFGFQLVKRLVDHRELGIDTVYYGLK